MAGATRGRGAVGGGRVAALLVAMWGLPPVAAQVPATLDEELRRIFASNEYGPRGRFGPAVWIENGTAYTTLERSATIPEAQDIVRYDAATGDRSLYVDARQLIPSTGARPLAVEGYRISADGARVLIFTNGRQVWRTPTRGDFWVLDRRRGGLRQLGGADAPPSSLMFAKLSPAGDRVAYVRGGELYVERTDGGDPVRLTTGADSLHVNGRTDWVYEEELFLQDGFRWSPDGRRIAYWHFDMTGVGTFSLINNTDSIYPILTPIQYPKVGTTNSAVRIGVVGVDGGTTRWIDLAGDPREHYVARMDWAGPDSVVLQRLNRLQNTNWVIVASAETGVARVALTERDSAWIDPPEDVRWLDAGRAFLWPSERDGWKRLYRVSRAGDAVTPVTPPAVDVTQVVAIVETSGWVYYLASPENATQRYLYRSSLRGPARTERVSPAAQPGTHGYQIAPNGEWAIHTYSTAVMPPIIDLVRLPDHRPVRALLEDPERRKAVGRVVDRPVEFLRVTVGPDVDLDGWLIKPPNFDSTKRYPLLVYVYGEPWGTTVVDAFGGGNTLWFHALAAHGYLVASFDNRGTRSPRGRDFRKSVHRQIGVLSSADQAAAVRQLAAQRRYVDPGRVAIWGWSGGGSSTLQAMFRYPDVYQVGMAVASVPDQLLYDTIYQERYMGLPGDGDAYGRASPINFAEGLKGRLLVVHGTGDDNVHYQGAERLINRLITLGKSFDVAVYPNRSHCICEGAGTVHHVYATLTRYLLGHLAPGPR
jgi:dipeptidyl-peptidase-4